MTALDVNAIKTHRCCMCEVVLPLQRLHADPVCSSALCRHRYAQLSRESLCSQCRRPLVRANRRRRHCDDQACRRAHARELVEGREQARVRQRAELRARAARRLGVPDPDAYQVLDLPSQRVPIVRLSAPRRAKFRAYLEGLVEWVWHGEVGPIPVREPVAIAHWRDTPPAPVPAATTRAVIRACTLCKGGCCLTGAGHAWIDAKTIRRYIAANPDRSAQEIVDAYMATIKPRSYRGSCVYHGPAGCTQTPALRADICHNFFCRSTDLIRHDVATTADGVKVFFVIRDTSGKPRGSFVNERRDPPPQ